MISVVTVNYKTVDYLEAMLESLFQFHNSDSVEVFVIENGSGDDLSHLERRFPFVNYIYSKNNLGFAGGCNLGIKRAKGQYVALINPDIVFVDNALQKIEEKLDMDLDVGIGGVSLRNIDRTLQNCVWRFPQPFDQLLVLLKIPHMVKNIKAINKWKMKGFDYSKSAFVDQVMGAFFCIRRDVIDQIGLLDGGFFIWYEEVDFAKRAKNAGWNTCYYSDIIALHKGGGSFDRVATIRKQAIIRRSLRRYMRKHHGLSGYLLFTIPEPIFIFISAVAAVIKPK